MISEQADGVGFGTHVVVRMIGAIFVFDDMANPGPDVFEILKGNVSQDGHTVAAGVGSFVGG